MPEIVPPNVAERCLEYGRQFRRATTAAGRESVLQSCLDDDQVPLFLREAFLDWVENAAALPNAIEQIKWAQLKEKSPC